MMLIVDVVSLLLEVLFVVETTQEGSPFDACESMNIHGSQPQTGPCPFRFVFGDKTEIFANQSVHFLIKAQCPLKFKGFMVQARNEQDQPIGHFDLHSYNIKVFSCPGGNRNTVTHSRAEDNEEIDMDWFPPFAFKGVVTFYATVAKDRETFWVKQKVSPVVTVR